MAFNYFQNQSFIGIHEISREEGISSLDSERQNQLTVGAAVFRSYSHTASTSLGNKVYTWTVPIGVTSVSIVCVGGGGGGMVYNNPNSNTYSYAMNGGSGGALAWLNNFPVTPGSTINVQVGTPGRDGFYSTGSTAGGDSYFSSTSIINAGGGQPGRYRTIISGGTYTVSSSYGTSGGGNGGNSHHSAISGQGPAGGGGAGGYSGNGGTGRDDGSSSGDNGSGGAGGGGGASANATFNDHFSGGGGGVGIYGEGSSGSGQTDGSATGGSGGQASSIPTDVDGSQVGGNFGGGGGGKSGSPPDFGGAHAGNGGEGIVRVIWGPNRSFPSTNVGQDYLGIVETTYTA